MENAENKKDYSLHLSIIAAALIIAVAWIYSAGLKSQQGGKVENESGKASEEKSASSIENVIPVSDSDYIKGDKNAKIKIIEFSDMECPFCKRFHGTMKQVMAEYDGQVAWVYRHWPLEQLHSKAKTSAMAAECAGDLGGNEKFWQYLDKYLEITPTNNQINLEELPNIAESVGLNREQFNDCLSSEKYKPKIESQIKNAFESNPECPRCGTPFSVIIAENGKKYPLAGAYPYEDVKAIIDEALSQ